MKNQTIVSKPTFIVDYDELQNELIAFEQKPKNEFMSIVMLNKEYNFVKKSKIDGTIHPYWSERENIMKLSMRRVLLVKNYAKRVTTNGAKEGINEDYISKALKGKKHLPNSCSVLTDLETETQRYVMLEIFENIKDFAPTYHLNGNELDKDILKKFISYPNKPIQLGQNKKVIPITPNFKSLIEVHFEHKRLVVKHP